jgi:hypothetical protein
MREAEVPMEQYIHPELNKRVEFFAGSYLFLEEGRLSHQGKEVLYLVGMASVESSCCGARGCAFIKVPGYVLSWKQRKDEHGQALSDIERIEDQKSQREICNILEEKHPGFSQIEFV